MAGSGRLLLDVDLGDCQQTCRSVCETSLVLCVQLTCQPDRQLHRLFNDNCSDLIPLVFH
jgi:hypothetical protein